MELTKRQSIILTSVTVTFTLLWLVFFFLNAFSESFRKASDDPGVGVILFLMFFGFFTFIFPFAGLYLWFQDHFKIKSKYFVVLLFSLTPWIFILLAFVRDTILEWLFGCNFGCLFHSFI